MYLSTKNSQAVKRCGPPQKKGEKSCKMAVMVGQ